MSNRLTPCAIALDQVLSRGTGLRRPECVLATESGDLFVAHLGSGVMHIAPDGRQRAIGAVAEIEGKPWIPNGIALTRDGDFLIANMGEGGGLWRLSGRGEVTPFLRAVDGVTLTATNFVTADRSGRLWVTVTTRQWPISKAMTAVGPHQLVDGYLFVVDEAGARIVADGFAFANEVRLNKDESEAYIVETFGRRITRFKVAEGEPVAPRDLHRIRSRCLRRRRGLRRGGLSLGGEHHQQSHPAGRPQRWPVAHPRRLQCRSRGAYRDAHCFRQGRA